LAPATAERFRGPAPPAEPADAVGGAVAQAGDEGDEGVAAEAELVGLQGGVPAALLLVQAAEQQVHLGAHLPVGVGVGLAVTRRAAFASSD
jgi:hypothetical protein